MNFRPRAAATAGEVNRLLENDNWVQLDCKGSEITNDSGRGQSFRGFFCGIIPPAGGFILTDDTHATVSASGQATLSCKYYKDSNGLTGAADPVEKVVDINETVDIGPLFVTNRCDPGFEFIPLEGTLHFILKIWDNGHVKIHGNAQLSGTNLLPPGEKYVANDQFNFQGHFADGGPLTINNNLKLISQGNTDNKVLNLVLHVSPNGDLTFNFADGACRG